MENLNSLAVFVRAAETLSYVAAGRMLGISASAVGKAITRLETSLNVRLFHRSTRQIALTEEGMVFFERCLRILDDLKEAEMELQKSTAAPTGRLRVSMPAVGYRLLMEKLPMFTRQFPGIELDLDFSDRLVDIIDERFDAVIRSGVLPDSRLMAKCLGPVRFVVSAAPSYLSKNPELTTPDDLDGHACIRFRYPSTGKLQDWNFMKEADTPALRIPATLVCNSTEALLSAAVAGLGLVYLPYFVVKESVGRGELRIVLEPFEVDEVTFWLMWASSRHMLPRLRAFVDFVSQHVKP